MGSEVIMYEAGRAIAKTSGKNYKIASPIGGAEVLLKRDVDFGVIPGTKSPSLFKSGAEKVCMAYGLLQHYTTESKIEQYDQKGVFFYYLVKCELVKIANDGREYVFATGYGSANTAERRNGRNTGVDAINSSVKMAQKRALVAAALSISGLSDMFTMDMEDEKFMSQANEFRSTLNEDSPLTKPQWTRLYAIAGDKGLKANEVKEKLKVAGYEPGSIKQKDYDAVCDIFLKAE